jgi:hypothetical protein
MGPFWGIAAAETTATRLLGTKTAISGLPHESIDFSPAQTVVESGVESGWMERSYQGPGRPCGAYASPSPL